MDYIDIEQEQYDKLKNLIINNSLNEAKEYAYELLRLKNKDLICYLFLVKIYAELNNHIKVQNIISKIKDQISYYNTRPTRYYKSQIEKYKEMVNENSLGFNGDILIQLKELTI